MINIAHIVKCSICDTKFDRDKIAFVMSGARRYAHASCALREAAAEDKPLEEILKGILDYACENGIIQDTANSRDLFDIKLMGILSPMPREVIAEFKRRYAVGSKILGLLYFDFCCCGVKNLVISTFGNNFALIKVVCYDIICVVTPIFSGFIRLAGACGDINLGRGAD